MRFGSLFAGVGGFDIAFEDAGFQAAWFCEIEPFCQAVLRRHWPTVPGFADIRELTAENTPSVDMLLGGFPCQDISSAGKGAGIHGERSALWFEYLRLIGELRPRWVVAENVQLLRSRGLDVVAQGLAEIGYDAEWDVIRASDVGAPHQRARMWIVAYPAGEPGAERRVFGERIARVAADALGVELRDEPGRLGGPNGQGARVAPDDGQDGDVADAARHGRGQPEETRTIWERTGTRCSEHGADCARRCIWPECTEHDPDADELGLETDAQRDRGQEPGLDGAHGHDADGLRDAVADAEVAGRREGGVSGLGRGQQEEGPQERPNAAGRGREGDAGAGLAEPGLGRGFDGVSSWLDGSWEYGVPRVAEGVPNRVQRLRALGNALVPAVPYLIARAIADYELEHGGAA